MWERRDRFAPQIEAYCTGCKFFIAESVGCSQPLAGLHQKQRALEKSCSNRSEEVQITVVGNTLEH